jgi:putative ABC transport system permease protein
MKTTDILKLSLNSLTHRGLRSWLTILGIIIGVAAVIAMLSIGNGMSESVEAQMQGFGADILTVSPGYTQASGAEGGFDQMRKQMERMFGGGTDDSSDDDPELTDTDIYAIKEAEGVAYVQGVISGSRVEVEYLSENVNLNIEGVDPIVWIQMTTSSVESGRFLDYGDSNSVVIGSSVATMFDQPLTVNTQIKIEGSTYKIIGILGTSGTGGFGGDDRTIFMTHDAARDLTEDIEASEYTSIEVKIVNTDYLEEITRNIEDVLYYSRLVNEETQDFTVSSNTGMVETITSTMETLSFFLIGIAAISLIVGAIGIANTMFMSVMERTRLIGILKSLGTRNSEIMKLFLAESGIIGFMGGVMGIFFGFIFIGIISDMGISFMNMGRMGGATTSVAIITPELLVFALIFSTVIGIISGLIPARQAAKLQVVEAMRSE